jgi:hypothetical protein
LTPNWTILIATLGQRQERFQRLLQHLLPQIEQAEGRVNVLAYWNNGERPLAEVRQALVEEADGTHISFVDDDDLVASTYVSCILKKLTDTPGIDYVGFRLQCYVEPITVLSTTSGTTTREGTTATSLT